MKRNVKFNGLKTGNLWQDFGGTVERGEELGAALQKKVGSGGTPADYLAGILELDVSDGELMAMTFSIGLAAGEAQEKAAAAQRAEMLRTRLGTNFDKVQ